MLMLRIAVAAALLATGGVPTPTARAGDPAPGGDSVRVPLDGDPALLRLAAEKFQANFAALQTWSGRAVVETVSSGFAFDERHTKSVVEFAYEQKRNARRWNSALVEDRREGPRVDAAPVVFWTHSGMRLPGLRYSFGPNPPGPRAQGAALVVRPDKDDRGENLADDFDPVFFFQAVEHDLPAMLVFHADSPAAILAGG